MAGSVLDDLEASVARALNEATHSELHEALQREELPRAASEELHRGGASLISLGEERARREIDARFAEVLTSLKERDVRIDKLEREVAKLLAQHEE